MAKVMGRTETCLKHPDRPAVIRCPQCHKPLCAQCVISTTEGKFCSRVCSDKAAAFRTAAASQAETVDSPVGGAVKRITDTIETVKRWVFTAVKFAVWTVIIIVALWAVNRFFFKIPIIGDVIFNPGVAANAQDGETKPAGDSAAPSGSTTGTPASATATPSTTSPGAAQGSAASLQNWSSNKLNDTLEEFYSYVPIFRSAGFDVTGVSVEVGLIPKLDATFSQIRVLTPEEQKKVLKEQEKKTVLCFLLRSLFATYNMKMSRFSLSYVTMSLSIPPHTILGLEVKSEEPKTGESDAAPAPEATGKPKAPPQPK